MLAFRSTAVGKCGELGVLYGEYSHWVPYARQAAKIAPGDHSVAAVYNRPATSFRSD